MVVGLQFSGAQSKTAKSNFDMLQQSCIIICWCSSMGLWRPHHGNHSHSNDLFCSTENASLWCHSFILTTVRENLLNKHITHLACRLKIVNVLFLTSFSVCLRFVRFRLCWVPFQYLFKFFPSLWVFDPGSSQSGRSWQCCSCVKSFLASLSSSLFVSFHYLLSLKMSLGLHVGCNQERMVSR